MKALILCGGLARRLDPLSYFLPKPLLPIGGKPIVDYILDDVVDSGVSEVILATNSVFSGQFEHWKARAAAEANVNIRLVVEPMDEVLTKGAVGGMDYAIKEGNIDADTLIVAGDQLYDFHLRDMVDDFKRRGRREPVVGCFDVGSPGKAKRFGVLELDADDKVISFVEKPSRTRLTLVCTAMYILPRGGLKKVGDYMAGNNNPDNTGNFVWWLSNETTVRGHVFTGHWYDIGTLSTYKEVFDLYGGGKGGRQTTPSSFFDWFTRSR